MILRRDSTVVGGRCHMTMRNPFVSRGPTMSQAIDTPSDSASAAAPPVAPAATICPFCGTANADVEQACGKCRMQNTPATRKATRARIGPWYVLQTRNPAAPGMKFETLIEFVRKGQVTPRSIVRGPTTHQFWKLASQVKGLSREFGLCFSCGGAVDPTGNLCPHCNRLQEPPMNPNALLEAKDPGEQKPRVYRELRAPAPGLLDPVEDDVAPISAPIPAPTPKVQRPAPVPARPPVANVPANRPAPAQVPAAANNGRKDSILSAKDLAAAFQLDFTPSAEFTPETNIAPPRSGTWRKAVAAVLLVGGAAATSAYFLHLPFQKATNAWTESTYASAKGWISDLSAKATAPVKTEAAPATIERPAPVNEKPSAASDKPAPVAEIPVRVADKPAAVTTVQPPAPAVDRNGTKSEAGAKVDVASRVDPATVAPTSKVPPVRAPQPPVVTKAPQSPTDAVTAAPAT